MAGLQEHRDAFREEQIQLVALSADEREAARRMKNEENLDFPVLYGLEPRDMEDRYGLYIVENDRIHLQPAQFILDPGGKIRLASYSSGKVGRLGAEEALEEIRGLRNGD